jgi:hypothetical protein
MRSGPIEVLLSRPFLISICTLNSLLLFAYWSPKDSVFPVHDFLDQFYVLYTLRGDNPDFFDFSAVFSGVLGQLPLNMLGINDLSLEANLYVLFRPEIAAVLNEFITRNMAFIGMYLLIRKLLSDEKNAFVFALPSLLFALLPYYPYFGFTIAGFPIIAVIVLDLLTKHLSCLKIFSLLFVALSGNFTYGGFVALGILLVVIIFLFLKRDYGPARRIAVVFSILSLGYFQGISRLISLKLDSNFSSHRTSWQPLSGHWLDLSLLPNLFSEFVNVTLRGQYHFPSGQSVLTNHFIPGVFVILLFPVLIHLQLSRRQKTIKPSFDQEKRKLLKIIATSILLINLFYALESVGFTQFEYLPSEPFQFKRVTVLNPVLWTILLGLILSIISTPLKRMVPIAWLLIVAQISMSHVGIQQKILEVTGFDRNRPSLVEYFDKELYEGLARKIEKKPQEINVLSFGLDPMIASFNGYKSFDGYLYNYPLDYKLNFREIISTELDLSPSLKDYFDGWGSRVYLFHRDVPVSQVKLNWCASKYLGVDFVLAKEELESLDNLKLFENFKNLRLYKIVNC